MKFTSRKTLRYALVLAITPVVTALAVPVASEAAVQVPAASGYSVVSGSASGAPAPAPTPPSGPNTDTPWG
jgi:hypothetical protein